MPPDIEKLRPPASVLSRLGICLLRCLARCPPAAYTLLVRLASILAPRLAKKEKQRFDKNVERIFGLPPHSEFAREFARQVMEHQLRSGLETLKIIHHPEQLKLLGLEQAEQQMVEYCQSQRPLIFVTAHLGSWELCAYMAQKLAQRPLYVLAKPARSPHLTTILNYLREKMQVSVLWTGQKTLLRSMMTAMHKGEALGFVMDQKPDGRQGHEVDFFAQKTPFVGGPASMALRFDAPVIAIFCFRVSYLCFRLQLEVIRKSGDSETSEDKLTARMAAAIERAIKAYPEQWTWNYKRWSDAPPSPQGV